MEKLLRYEVSRYGVEKEDGMIVAPSIFKLFRIVFRSDNGKAHQTNLPS